jgi:UDP-glucose 4-epimerase
MKTQSLEGENWLITGGLGYIGSHIAREFISEGAKVFILDNMSTGKLIRKPIDAVFISGDMRDAKLVRETCFQYDIVGVIHLAAFKHARESKVNPSKYWINNVGATLGLVEGIEGSRVSKVIMSSSCSIYGDGSGVDENSPANPQSPYALTKRICEELLGQTLPMINISLSSLRFFNVIGCDNFPESYDSSQECLIPVITSQILMKTSFSIFGNSHTTNDGTCLRDYLDVRDLARAHTVVAGKLNSDLVPMVINVSTGKATSVLQVLKEFESVIGKKIAYGIAPANPADPSEVWSIKSKILDDWGWQPKFSLHDSISAHWNSVLKGPS